MTANLRIHPTNGWSVRGLALAQWQPHLLFLQLRLCISALTQQIKCKWCSKDWKAMKVMKDTNSTWQMWNALKPSSYAMLWNMTFFTVFKLHFLQRQIQCDYFGVSNLSLRNQLIKICDTYKKNKKKWKKNYHSEWRRCFLISSPINHQPPLSQIACNRT